MNEPVGVQEPRYDGTKCPLCNNPDVRRIFKGVDSDLACSKCGQMFYSLDHEDPSLAGQLKGGRIEVPNEGLYEIADKNRKEDAKNVGNL